MKMNVSVTAYLMKALSLAINDFPIMNSHYNVSAPFEYKKCVNHNISLAVDSPKGLVVPNIKNCQNLTIIQLQKELDRLKKDAEAGRVSIQDQLHGTISISNIGTIGATYTGPVILPPQVCIIGVGRVQTLPRYGTKKNAAGELAIVPRKIVSLPG